MKKENFIIAKRFLGEYQYLTFKAQAIKENIERIKKQMQTPNSTSIIVMETSARETKNNYGRKYLNDYVNILIDLENKHLSKLKEIEIEKIKLVRYIENTLVENEKKVIYLRFCESYSFERIAVEMCYSYRQIMRFYYRGLRTIENELSKEKERLFAQSSS